MKKSFLSILAILLLSVSNVSATEKTPDAAFNPFKEIQKMQKQMDRIFDKFHQEMMNDDSFSKFSTTFPTSPAMDLKDVGDKYILKVDIPGSDKNEINVSAKDGVLKIEAKKTKEEKEKHGNFLKQERFASDYMRMITLPKDADSGKLKSVYKNGVLEITIPKKD